MNEEGIRGVSVGLHGKKLRLLRNRLSKHPLEVHLEDLNTTFSYGSLDLLEVGPGRRVPRRRQPHHRPLLLEPGGRLCLRPRWNIRPRTPTHPLNLGNTLCLSLRNTLNAQTLSSVFTSIKISVKRQ